MELKIDQCPRCHARIGGDYWSRRGYECECGVLDALDCRDATVEGLLGMLIDAVIPDKRKEG